MKEREALKLALDLLRKKEWEACDYVANANEAADILEKALAQPEQEPVAKNEEGRITWLVDNWPQNCFLYAEPFKWTPVEIGVDVTSEGAHVVGMYVLPDAVRYVFYSQFHTAPQRTWVGLTEKDKQTAFDDTQEGGGFWEFADAIEAKLKEKNT